MMNKCSDFSQMQIFASHAMTLYNSKPILLMLKCFRGRGAKTPNNEIAQIMVPALIQLGYQIEQIKDIGSFNIHAEISALFGDYITILKVVSRGLVHGPRPEQNHPTLIEFRKHYRQDVGRYKGSGFVSDASAR